MSSPLVGEHLDVVEERHLGVAAAGEMLTELVLDGGEPTLYDRGVVAVPPAAHAPGHPMRLEELLVVLARLRAPLVGVMQESCRGRAAFQRHLERLDDQMAIVNGTDGPADQVSRVEVENRREIELPAAADHEIGGIADPPLVRRVRDAGLREQIRRNGWS